MQRSVMDAAEGPWFDLPDADYVRRADALSNRPDITAAAAEFRQNGYLVRDFGFAEADLAAAAAFTAGLAGRKVRMQDAWMVQPAVRNLAAHPAVLEFLSSLYQRAAFPFQTLNFGRGSQQSAHADSFFFSARPAGFMCGVWVALEDIHPDSGALFYYAGSQRSGVKPTGPGYDAAQAAQVAARLEGQGLKPETALIRRGQAFIWASDLVHGGTPIADPKRTRLSQVSHYYFEGCSYLSPVASESGEESGPDSGPESGGVFWREPYDIAARRFVANLDPAHRPRLRYRLGQRLRIWGRRPHTE